MNREEKVLDLKVLRKIHTGVQEKETEGFHPFHELFYIAEGTCSVFIENRAYRMKAGEFAVIPAGALHRTD